MSDVLKSASKIVFILLAITASAGFLIGKLDTANFMLLVGSAFTFYFSNKGDSGTPYAGK